MVHPHNTPESVAMVLDALAYDDATLDRHFHLEPTDDNIQLPPAFIFDGECSKLKRFIWVLIDNISDFALCLRG